MLVKQLVHLAIHNEYNILIFEICTIIILYSIIQKFRMYNALVDCVLFTS